MKKAQTSHEILFAMGIILFIFIILMLFTSYQKVSYDELEHNLEAFSDCYNLANILSSVYAADDGTQTSLRTDYTINIANNSILRIDYEDEPRATCSAYAKLTSGTYTGNLIITKENGEVIITES